MSDERRRPVDQTDRQKEGELNEAQLMTLRNIEGFGWQLKFVRHELFHDPIPVLYDPDTDHYAILEADGELNEDHDLEIRD